VAAFCKRHLSLALSSHSSAGTLPHKAELTSQKIEGVEQNDAVLVTLRQVVVVILTFVADLIVKPASLARRGKFTSTWCTLTDLRAKDNLMLRDPLFRFGQCVAMEW
jgi:hypothetical protein